MIKFFVIGIEIPLNLLNTDYYNMKRKLTFWGWIGELFEDERGRVSIKPVIAFMGATFLCATMLIGAVWQKEFKPADYIVNAVMIITVMGMGGDTVDKFSLKKPDPSQIDPNQIDPNQQNPNV